MRDCLVLLMTARVTMGELSACSVVFVQPRNTCLACASMVAVCLPLYSGFMLVFLFCVHILLVVH